MHRIRLIHSSTSPTPISGHPAGYRGRHARPRPSAPRCAVSGNPLVRKQLQRPLQRCGPDPAGRTGDGGEGPLATADGRQHRTRLSLRGNSAASDRSADTSRAETESLSASSRKSHSPAPRGHSAQISGSPPVTSAASKASAGSNPSICPTSAGFSSPSTILPAALVEGASTAVQGIHHRQVGADEDQQDRLGLQCPVPGPLQHPLKGAIGIHQVRDLVDDQHAHPVGGQRSGQHVERGVPALRPRGGHEPRHRQRRRMGVPGQPRKVIPGGRAGRRVEQERGAGAIGPPRQPRPQQAENNGEQKRQRATPPNPDS